MARDIVSDSALKEILERLHQLGDETDGQIPRSLIGVRGFLDQIIAIRAKVQALVTAGNPSVTAADVTAITDLRARLVQSVKDWAASL